MNACEYNDVEYVRRYIDCGGNIETHTVYGDTPILRASRYESCDVVRLLFENGADINARNGSGKTPVMIASQYAHEETVRFLVDSGADLNVRDRNENTLVMEASIGGCEEIVRLFIKKGCDINAKNDIGDTPIIGASWLGFMRIIHLLVETGADIIASNHRGETALSIALRNGRFNVVLFLAPKMISDQRFPYSGAPVSMFIPQHRNIDETGHGKLLANLIPIYLNRAVEDSAFGMAMQRDVEEILGGKAEGYNRNILTEKDSVFLTKLLKTLRSVDYTDRIRQDNNEETSPAYDMEL